MTERSLAEESTGAIRALHGISGHRKWEFPLPRILPSFSPPHGVSSGCHQSPRAAPPVLDSEGHVACHLARS
jgi:hypothetical protein